MPPFLARSRFGPRVSLNTSRRSVHGEHGGRTVESGAGSTPSRPQLDAEGRYHARARISYLVVGAYLLMLILIALVVPRETVGGFPWVPTGLAVLVIFFLVRYLTTTYRIDDQEFRAIRLLGGRRIALEEIRKIEYASLRDLIPSGGFLGLGTWGWRGRMWSTTIGYFDSIYTDAANGLLVTAGDHPIYISPRSSDEFARELSRRVRSYTGPLLTDVGAPAGAQ